MEVVFLVGSPWISTTAVATGFVGGRGGPRARPGARLGMAVLDSGPAGEVAVLGSGLGAQVTVLDSRLAGGLAGSLAFWPDGLIL